MRSNIDTLRTDFENSSGETSSIWLWKGNYNMVFNGGWHIGAEIGAYGNYGEADDSMFKSVSFELIDKNTGKFVSRSVDGKYWTNRFDKGKCNPADLVLTGTLNFKNEKDAKAYCDAVNAGTSNNFFTSKDRSLDSYKVKATNTGNTVKVTFE